MNDRSRRHEMATKPVVYRIPGMHDVVVRRDVIYRERTAGASTFDVYSPPDAHAGTRSPAVVLVIGYSDETAVPRFGCAFKEMESFVNWAQLLAASGVVAITYTNVEPAADARAVLAHVCAHAAELGIDAHRIGVWACSGNVPVALSLMLRGAATPVSCAALLYGLMLDPPGKSYVADASRLFGFEHACAGKTLDDLVPVPVFVARAGQDAFAHLNDTIDAFATAALARNRPITLVNHAAGPHSFDVVDDTDASREVIRQILEFFRFNLRVSAPARS